MEQPPQNPSRVLENPKINRQEIVNLFARLRLEKGVRHPDDPGFNEDPEVKMANSMFFAWVEQEDAKTGKIGTRKAYFESLLSKDLFYVDAGFDDPDYLDEVASEFLASDLDNAEGVTDEDLSETINKFREKIAEIRSKIGGDKN